ncbi:PP2C family protein-serine/threonine phosphatase [Streptomyces sp. NPDC004111]|uniref:PP2C family protein-serine/threonine phosphatase n=1 Tax=Streptomyces sp. NPDC004111 TaxID=3364690 RepID=UPI0036854F1D
MHDKPQRYEPVRLVLGAGSALGVLVPVVHNSMVSQAGAELGMTHHELNIAQVLGVVAALTGLFAAGRAVDVHGVRRVVLGALAGTTAGGLLLLGAAGPWTYWAGRAVEVGSVMGLVVAQLASVRRLHLSGRIGRAIGSAFAVTAAVLLLGLLLRATVDGGRTVQAVPLVGAVGLWWAAHRFLPRDRPDRPVARSLPFYPVASIALIVVAGGLQATPLRGWSDFQVALLLGAALTLLALCCTPEKAEVLRLPRHVAGRWRKPVTADSHGPRVFPVAVAGAVLGFLLVTLVTVVPVLLTARGAGQVHSAVALGGFCVGFAAAGLCARERVVTATTGASLGLTFAAVSLAFLTALPTGPLAATAVATALTALMAFGTVLAQVPCLAGFLIRAPARAAGSSAVAYPAAIVLGGSAVTALPYETALSAPQWAAAVYEVLWIAVTTTALAAVVLGRSAVAISVASAAAAQYLLVTVIADEQHARRPLSITAFLTVGVIVGMAVWARGRQAERYARTRAAAEALQEAVLRPLPPHLGTLGIAGLYRPATADTGVGGDFFEALHTPYGTRFLIGDVRGKGLQAVQTVTDVLGCFRSQAYETPDLTELAARLDRQLQRAATARGDTELFATALLLEHPDHGDHTLALNHGHLAPLALTPGHTREVELPALLPLGFGMLDGEHGPAPAAVPLPPGTALLLYTDGLTEARDADGRFYPLAQRVANVPVTSPEALVHHLVADVTAWTPQLTDDIAVIVLTPATGHNAPRNPAR